MTSTQDQDDFDVMMKLVIVGEMGVGKTNLLLRYTEDKFDEGARSTMGVDMAIEKKELQGKQVKLQWFDSAGQERFRALTAVSFQRADIAIFVYDITRRISFDNLAYWIEVVQTNAQTYTKFLFVGNKNDLESERQVPAADGQALAQKHSAFFFETSAKTNQDHCVNTAFDKIIDEALKEILASPERMGKIEEIQKQLKKDTEPVQEKKKCCFI